MPLVLRACERGFEPALVADTRQAAMFTHLIRVDRVDDGAREPRGLGYVAFRQDLLREFAKSVAIPFGGLRGHLQCAFGFGIIRREQNAPIGLDREDTISGLEPEAIRHVFR
jgi:hypothetical protein